MVAIFLVICSTILHSCHAEKNKEMLPSPWGINYTKLEISTGDITNVQIYVPQSDKYLTDSDIGPGSISHLTDNGYPGNGWINVDNDITYDDECVAPTDLDYYAEPDQGLEYIITLKTTFEIYRADLSFAYDFPSGNGYYVPPLDIVYMETDDGTKTKDTTDYYEHHLHPDDDSDADVDSDWKMWHSDLPTERTQAPTTTTLSFYIRGPLGDCVQDANKCHFLLCEIDVYGYLVTANPTKQPTKNPVAPSFSPTLAPSNAPTSTPSAAPSTSPTVDACPNFAIQQPCCAAQGGYHYVNYTYNKVTDTVVPDDELGTCFMALNASDCCGNGVWNPEVDFEGTLHCLDGASIASGEDEVCDVNLLVNKPNTTWYGYETVSGRNKQYSDMNYSAQTYTCSCDYTINICEVRNELTCIGSDRSYQNDYELCAVDDTHKDVFVGGGMTDIETYTGAVIDHVAETCECEYIGDNCEDDIAKRDEFDAIGYGDDNDTCSVNFIQDCCMASELAFGGTAISQLDLATYVTLAQAGGNTWGCVDGSAYCDAENVPAKVNDNEKISYLSWLYNEAIPTVSGFDANSICKCLITFDNCTTYNPTAATSEPTSVSPTRNPTPAPTTYQFTDFNTSIVIQPCCGDHTVSAVGLNQCPADNSGLCDHFQGNSRHIVNTGVDNSSACECSFEIGFWDWNIPSGGHKRLDMDVWKAILGNITWTHNASRMASFRSNHGVRRLLASDIACFDFYVSNATCDGAQTCTATDGPIPDDADNVLQNFGYTMESWNEWTTEINNCFCYWMYYLCYVPETTIMTTQTEPPLNSTFVLESTQFTVTDATEKPKPSDIQGYMDVGLDMINEYPIYAVAAGIGLCCACCMFCLLCLKSRKSKKTAKKNQKQLEKSQGSTKRKEAKKKPKKKPKKKRESSSSSSSSDGGKQTAPTAGPLATNKVKPTKASYSPVPPQDAAIEMQEQPVHESMGAGVVKKQAKQVPMDDDMYWFVFETKPFGLTFGKMAGDKKNLYVTAIDADSPGANGRVIVGSKVVAFESEYVEDMGAKKIFKTFSGKYAEVLPLKITFRKPEEAPQVEEEEVVQAAVVSKGLTQAVEEEEYEYYEEEEYEEE